MKSYLSNEQAFSNSPPGLLRMAGCRYWPASLLPTLVGTTLPFWLKPPGFEFKAIEAIIFLIAILLLHSSFSLLNNLVNGKRENKRTLIAAIICFVGVVSLGIYLNSTMQLHKNVFEYIFSVYGFTAVFVGVLYILPPFSFHKRVFGEMVISVFLGMVTTLGAYLVQVGDITRTVYLASAPMVLSIGLWAWISKLISRPDDEEKGNSSMVMLFPQSFAARFVPIFILLVMYLSMPAAIFGRNSLNPLSMIAFVSIIPAIKLIILLWKDYQNINTLLKARTYAGMIFLIVCTSIILSSLVTSMC